MALTNLIPGVPQLKLAVAAVALAGVFAAGWKVESWRWGAAETAALVAEQKQIHQEEAKANQASASLVQKEEQVRVVTQQVTKYVDRIVEKPVYRNVCLEPDGLRAVNGALAGKAPDTGKPDGAVPPAHAP